MTDGDEQRRRAFAAVSFGAHDGQGGSLEKLVQLMLLIDIAVCEPATAGHLPDANGWSHNAMSSRVFGTQEGSVCPFAVLVFPLQEHVRLNNRREQ